MRDIFWRLADVAPALRFSYWREAVCQSFMPLEPEDLSCGQFDGSLEGIAGATLQITRVRSAPTAVKRTRRGISSFQNGSFFANLQLSGVAVVEQNGDSTTAYPGDIILVDTNVPFTIRSEHGCNLVCATIPDGTLRRRLAQCAKRPAVIRGTGVGQLASSYLSGLKDFPNDFELVDDLASEQLGALLARAAVIQAGGSYSQPRRAVTAKHILDFITDELNNPQLSAKYVCRTLGISRSSLFSLLSETNITFASHIREQRLQGILTQLRDPRLTNIGIGELARRFGFASQESFTRAFTRRFGGSPGTYRATADLNR